MNESNLAQRYALALIRAEAGDVSQVEAQLKQLGEVLLKDSKIVAFFQSPKVKASTKKSVFKKVLGEAGCHSSVVSLIMLLIDKGREAIIFDIIQELKEILRERSGHVNAFVTLPREFNQDETRQINEQLAEKLKSNRALFGLGGNSNLVVDVAQKVNPDILSGLVVTIGDYQWDASGRSFIHNWKKNVLKIKPDLNKIITQE